MEIKPDQPDESDADTDPNLEDIFASRGRTRILMYLAHVDRTFITEIVNATGLNHYAVVKHIKRLEEMGIIKTEKGREHPGPKLIISLDEKNESVVKVQDFILDFGDADP